MASEGAASRCILLAVPGGDQVAPIIESGFAAAGWPTRSIETVAQLAQAVAEQLAGLVVLDMALPGAREALEALKMDPATNWVPVVALFPRGSRLLRPAELRVRADVELVEPVAIQHLIAAAESKAIRSTEPVSTRKVCLLLPSRRADLERCVQMASTLAQATGLAEAARTSLVAAIREAVANAIQHGNQGDPSKYVQVEYRQNPATVTITVRDQGAGFDAQRLLRQAIEGNAADAARDRHRQGGKGGLGLLMLVRCTDQVRYNGAGNIVTLTKFLRERPS
ncbi:MAG TPA: ATP-binding protein [Planctomycetota bacterium]|nr:ATP-binding protein [Planctomycetota bacterium]HRR79721.1 ATP-binding protein [Planctomycetota bacterium]HRT93224.1 ATP-binding protein [Planctomycetota bacterium]